jgi:L-alanine-DL-glutamate epimerase-like enolase superfamily enzyme
MTAATVIRSVLAHRLPRQSPAPALELPEVVATAVSPPAGMTWPEHQTRFALELVGDGVSGWYGPMSEVILALVRDQYAPGLVGHDAAQHRRLAHRPVAGRHRTGAHARVAASVVELACWDLAGRAAGRSVTDLLGGVVRSSVPAYASALAIDVRHPAAAEAARWLVTQGFWGQKWALRKDLICEGPAAVAACLGALREAVPQAKLMIDGLGVGRVEQVLPLLPALESVGVTWAEDLLPHGSSGWARLSSSRGRVPLAAGETAYDAIEQTERLNPMHIDVWQVDVGWCGGLSRALHTVEVASDHGLPSFLHGDSLTAAAALAGTCCRDQVPAVEYHVTLEPVRASIMTRPPALTDGCLDVRLAPGLSDGYLVDPGQPVLVLATGTSG